MSGNTWEELDTFPSQEEEWEELDVEWEELDMLPGQEEEWEELDVEWEEQDMYSPVRKKSWRS